jgi:hypothetical protein
MIDIKQKGDFKNLLSFLKDNRHQPNLDLLRQYGEEGVNLLREATPKDSGKTAESWYYKIEQNNGSTSLSFYNSNENNGVIIAILLQYGHATGTGGYVEGIDYINPAVQPLFNELAEKVWKEVKR